jgi:integrase
MSLNDVRVRNETPGTKQKKLFDGDGMFLLVTPKGGKCWRLKYRFGGKEKVLALGTYPEISLADARRRREDARKLLANGVDPGEFKKAQKTATADANVNTFEKIAREWHTQKKSEWSDNHAGRLLRRLELDIFPFIGKKPITEIRTPELATLLERVAIRTLETAHRLKIAIDMVFKYAVVRGKCEQNPATSLRGVLPTVKYKHMAAPTDPKSLAPLLRAIDGFDGSFIVKCAMQLAPILFVRPGELRHAEWSEIDLEAAEWNIPAEKMKMKIAHLVPLPRQAVAILRELQPLTGHSKYVFPCHRSPLRCMSENAVNAGLRRLGFDKEEITGHGFRAVGRTLLDEVLGFRPDIIEHQLAHKVKDPLGRAYNRTSHLPERRKMMQTWADYLDGLKSGAQVIPLRRAE